MTALGQKLIQGMTEAIMMARLENRPSNDGSKPYWFLARDLSDPGTFNSHLYRQIINYADWLDGGGPVVDGVQVQTPAQMQACNFMAENLLLHREVYRACLIEKRRRVGMAGLA